VANHEKKNFSVWLIIRHIMKCVFLMVLIV